MAIKRTRTGIAGQAAALANGNPNTVPDSEQHEVAVGVVDVLRRSAAELADVQISIALLVDALGFTGETLLQGNQRAGAVLLVLQDVAADLGAKCAHLSAVIGHRLQAALKQSTARSCAP